MYQALLTRRYLFSKVMPLLAAVAVLLCTALVLVTWSVMSGFLVMLMNTGRTMTGDVTITWPNVGFPYYQELIERLEKDPAVQAAAPAIETFGLASTSGGLTQTVSFRGVDGPGYARVTRFADILWWKPVINPEPKDSRREDPRLDPGTKELLERIYKNGLGLTRPDPATGEVLPALVPGIQVTGLSYREAEKGYFAPLREVKRLSNGTVEFTGGFAPASGKLTMTIVPLDSAGQPIEAVTRSVPIANEFFSGVYDLDSRVVLVNLEYLQKLLRMNEVDRVESSPGGVRIDPKTGKEVFVRPTVGSKREPARVTHVLVRGKGDLGTTPEALAFKERVAAVYAGFAAAHPGEVPEASQISIVTWEQQNQLMISAVKKEIAVILFLFCLISLTAVFLVLAIFWAMVREKTQDIGVLRAIGAGKGGVAWLWVRYGLAIGLVGSALGIAGAYAIVININPIHEWLGRAFGLVIWDPHIYYFVMLPNKVDPLHAAIVFGVGVLSCALGALVPAIRAAWMDPVRALRNE